MPNINNRNLHGVPVNTTDATQTVAAVVETATDRAYLLTAKVVATETTDHDEAASYGRAATFANDGGTVSQVGSTTDLWTHEDTAGWDVDFNISGTDVRLRVTGAAATAVSWLVDIDVKELGQFAANSGFGDG